MVTKLLDPHIRKEYDEVKNFCQDCSIFQYDLKLDRQQKNTIDVYIYGRKDTFHDEGIFKFHDGYPNTKPTWRFCKPFPYNGHIYSDGKQCSDLESYWRSRYPNANLRIIIENAIDVLYQNSTCVTGNPFNCFSIYCNNRQLFNQNAKNQAQVCRKAFYDET